jgi:hypothetical protein
MTSHDEQRLIAALENIAESLSRLTMPAKEVAEAVHPVPALLTLLEHAATDLANRQPPA